MLSHEEKIASLKSVEMFEDASDQIHEKLAAIAEEVTFPKGERLITQAVRCSALFITVSGEMGITIEKEGSVRKIAKLSEPGKVVGEIGAVSGLVATASVTALSDEVTLLRLEGQQFHRIVSVEPELAATVLRSLARYLESTSSETGPIIPPPPIRR